MSPQRKCCIRRRFLYSKSKKVCKTCSIKAWAPKDFNLLNFFTGTCKNNCVCKPSLLQDLKVKIINVISGITVNQLAMVFREHLPSECKIV